MDGNQLFKAMDPMVAYERGLTTWAKWVEVNLDPSKTKVIFGTISPRFFFPYILFLISSYIYIQITIDYMKAKMITYVHNVLAERVVKNATTRDVHCLLLVNHTSLNNQEC